MVRDHVDDPPEAPVEHTGNEPFVLLRRADLGVDLAMVEDVVSVGAARPGGKVGGKIGVGDAQVVEVVENLLDVDEAELPVQLQSVGGPGTPRGVFGRVPCLGLEQRIGLRLGRGRRPGLALGGDGIGVVGSWRHDRLLSLLRG